MHVKPLLFGLLVAVPLLPACSSGSSSEDDTSSTDQSVSTSEIMARAQEWVRDGVPYCGGVRGGTDEICGGTCDRPSAAWDDFRTDCSGFVSWCWQIPSDPDTSTFSYDESGSQGWTSIPIDALRAGDAIVAEGHIKLFSSFSGSSAVDIFEEYDCGEVARETTQGFSRIGGERILIDGDDRPYHAIRRNALTASQPPAKPQPPKKGAPTHLASGPTGCGVIESGHGLAPGKAIRSCDNRFELVMQGDGNLVEYGPTGSLWSTKTGGTEGYTAVMQGDGNFVLYGKFSDAWFNTKTAGHAGARLNLQDDGNVVVYSGSKALWNVGVSYTSAPRQPTTKCGSIPGGFGLASGHSIESCDGRFELVMQSDGNLVMYQAGKALWNTGTDGEHGYKAEMQGDGNFVIYDGKGEALWNSGTSGHPGAGLDLQTDGNLVIYPSTGHAIWDSGTH